jgi:hypothetical protein
MKLAHYELMLQYGVLRQCFPAMNAILSCSFCLGETPDQTLERWRRVKPGWFYAS